jgi:2-amino-4-hydroxy-6-hydroxymethyldihydropteridine diphosphokinase
MQQQSQARTYSVYLGLGSSLGDRANNLQNAVNGMHNQTDGACTTVEAVSQVYESPHMGLAITDSETYPAHLNAVIRISTTLDPELLLDAIHNVEQLGGRERTVHWGPRTIDIDILLIDDLVIDTARLTVPHPGILHRPFVLLPLADVAPQIRLAGGETVESALQRIMNERPIIRRTADAISNHRTAGRM